jgi:hypothetical protein
MTHWGVLWRTYLVVHPLLAIVLSLAELPSLPAPAAAWHQAVRAGQFYFGPFFYCSMVPIAVVHLTVSWRYAHRAYTGRRALLLGLLLVLHVLAALRALFIGTPLGQAVADVLNPKVWLGMAISMVVGQAVVQPHWAFFRRLPEQRALRPHPGSVPDAG